MLCCAVSEAVLIGFRCCVWFQMLCGVVSDAVFGADLCEEVDKSGMEAPWAVVKCVQEIEQWCQEHSKCVQGCQEHSKCVQWC